jgi:hypothetical protein
VELNRLTKTRELDDGILLLQDAFTISTILRGMYYDQVVKIKKLMFYTTQFEIFMPLFDLLRQKIALQLLIQSGGSQTFYLVVH